MNILSTNYSEMGAKTKIFNILEEYHSPGLLGSGKSSGISLYWSGISKFSERSRSYLIERD